MSDGQVTYEIRGDDAKLGGDLARAEGLMSKAGTVWTAIGKAALTAIVGGTAAVVSFAKSSVETGAAFDKSMSQVAATMGLTKDEISETGGAFELLRDTAMKYGAETAFTTTQCADALNYMALAGYDAKTSVSMLPNVLSLAAAGSIDLAYASDMITDSQTALGLTLPQTNVLVDQMAKTASKSNTDVQQLGEAILTVGGTARYMAGGTEELNTVLGVLADNGIKGSEAGTHLRNMILSLSAPTTAAQKRLDDLGVSVFDANGNMRSFAEIFPELNAAMEDFTDQEKLDAFDTIFNVRDISTATALLGTTTKRWKELGEAIVDSDGAAAQMAATQLDNLAGDITILKSALEGLQIQISDALTPTLREFVQYGIDGLGRLTGAFKENGISGAMSVLGDVLSEAITYIVDRLPQMTEAGLSLIGALAKGVIDNLPEMLRAGLQAVLSLADGITKSVPELIPAIVTVILEIVEALIDNHDLMIDAGIDLVIALIDGIIAALPVLIEKAPEIIIKLVETLLENLPKIHEIGPRITEALISSMLSRTPQLAAAGKKALSDLKDEMLKNTGNFDSVALTLLDVIISALTGGLPELLSSGDSILSRLKENMTSTGSGFTVIGTNITGFIGKGILSGVDTVISAGKNILSKAKSAMSGISFASIGSGIINGIKTGLENGLSSLLNKVREIAGKMLNAAEVILDIHSPSRVFRDQISGNIVKGLVSGLDDKGPDAVKATERITSEMLDAVGLTVRAGIDTSEIGSAIDSVMGMTANISAAAQPPIVVYAMLNGSIDVDGFELAKITMQNLDDVAPFTVR